MRDVKKKLLSLKQKRELLQRMAAAVREGAALDAFCADENIGRETLFEHLAEMRALGTQGINPFLPDVAIRKITQAEKIRALEAMEFYTKKQARIARHFAFWREYPKGHSKTFQKKQSARHAWPTPSFPMLKTA